MSTWHCNACGESGEGDFFEQCWTMPLVDHGWPNSRHHWPTGKPASFDQATFFCAVRDRDLARLSEGTDG